MATYARIIITLAVLPGAFLAYKVYKLDKIESEPKKLLALLFLFGVISTIPAGIIESLLEGTLDVIFPNQGTLYNFILYFLVVAVFEEWAKYFVLKMKTWKDPAFDYVFDGIVYSVFVACGFAVFENILYGFEYGVGTLFLRAVTSIPGHIIFGIFMGHFYGMAKQAQVKGDKSQEKRYLRLAMFVPILLHGTYDFIASEEDAISALLFFVFIIILDIIAYKKIKTYSASDEPV